MVEGKQRADKAQPLPSTEKALIGQKLASQEGACSYEPGVGIREGAIDIIDIDYKANKANLECYQVHNICIQPIQ